MKNKVVKGCGMFPLKIAARIYNTFDYILELSINLQNFWRRFIILNMINISISNISRSNA